MNVLFKSIPIGIRADELAEFIESMVDEGDLDGHQLHIAVASIEMLEIQDSFTHPVEQFGLVRISPPEVAKKIIQKLDGYDFNEYHITVREYFDRSLDNDSRGENAKPAEDILDKRVNDRREHPLKHSRLI